MSALRVSVVAVQPAARLVLAGRIRANADLTLVLVVRSVDEISPEPLSPDTDIALIALGAGGAGIADVRRHRRRYPSVGVIALTDHEFEDECFEAIRAGAAAYAPIEISDSDLTALVRSVGRGEYPINDLILEKPELASRVLEQFRSATSSELARHGAIAPLTDRELEILRKVSYGMTNAEIGYALGISAQIVKRHIAAILRKLGANDRTQAVVTALRHGWVSMDRTEKVQSQPSLTPNERLILQLLTRGLSHAEIAAQLGMTAAEVTLTVRAIIRKLAFGQSGGDQSGQPAPLEP